MKLTKIVAVNVAVLLALLVVFDLAGYLLLPVDWNFSGYRPEASSRTDVAGLFYPRYYFEQRATRGFDIRPAAHGVSVTNNFYFPIEANELGCRDRKFSFNAEKPLIYAAGDSQTWGIVSTDARWTNLLENKSGIPVLNCGVPGTAQKH
jgi:hypothetical protein